MKPTSTFGQHARAVGDLEAENARLQAHVEELIEAITAPTHTGFYKCRLCGVGPYGTREEMQHAPQCRAALAATPELTNC